MPKAKRVTVSNSVENITQAPAVPWDLSEALKLLIKNRLNLRQVAEYFQIPKTTLFHRIKRYMAMLHDPKLNQA